MMPPNDMSARSNRRWIMLAGFLALCVAVEIVAGLLTNISVKDWYLTLRKPSWTPPGWVFGPVNISS